MPSDHFVGRSDAVARLHDVLHGREKGDGHLTIQSIEGPGGIGKTRLFDRALATTDLSERAYLTLRVDGNDPGEFSLVRVIARLIDSAEAPAIRSRPAGYYFPKTGNVLKIIEDIRADAIAELQQAQPDNPANRSALSRFLDLSFEAGKRINDIAPLTTHYFNAHKAHGLAEQIGEFLPALGSLKNETVGFFENLGIGDSISRRNAVKSDACNEISEALVSDLAAMLSPTSGLAVWKQLLGVAIDAGKSTTRVTPKESPRSG